MYMIFRWLFLKIHRKRYTVHKHSQTFNRRCFTEVDRCTAMDQMERRNTHNITSSLLLSHNCTRFANARGGVCTIGTAERSGRWNSFTSDQDFNGDHTLHCTLHTATTSASFASLVEKVRHRKATGSRVLDVSVRTDRKVDSSLPDGPYVGLLHSWKLCRFCKTHSWCEIRVGKETCFRGTRSLHSAPACLLCRGSHYHLDN